MIHAVIFSKNRACQLDLCLRTLLKHFPSKEDIHKVTVLFKATNEQFLNTYTKCSQKFPEVVFRKESKSDGFYLQLVRILSIAEPVPYVAFLTDDDIIYRKPPKFAVDIINHSMFGSRVFSLRLGRNTHVQDPYNGIRAIPPETYISGNGHTDWPWDKIPNHTNFGYPMSLDGHIFHQKEIVDIICDLPDTIENPNHLEIELNNKRFYLENTWMSSFGKSVLFNTPLNRVQSVCENNAGRWFPKSPEFLNEQYLNGKRLSVDNLDPEIICGCHQEVDLELV